MTDDAELRRRAIARWHARQARHSLADVAKPAVWNDQLPVLVLGGLLGVTVLASVLMRLAGG